MLVGHFAELLAGGLPRQSDCVDQDWLKHHSLQQPERGNQVINITFQFVWVVQTMTSRMFHLKISQKPIYMFPLNCIISYGHVSRYIGTIIEWKCAVDLDRQLEAKTFLWEPLKKQDGVITGCAVLCTNGWIISTAATHCSEPAAGILRGSLNTWWVFILFTVIGGLTCSRPYGPNISFLRYSYSFFRPDMWAMFDHSFPECGFEGLK